MTRGREPALKPFTTDGCSGGMSWAWRRLTGRPPPWEGACVDHDRVYHRGGTASDRLAADVLLMLSVAAGAGNSDHRGRPYLAIAMFLGVRLGGAPWWPLPWRWGYGRVRHTWRYDR